MIGLIIEDLGYKKNINNFLMLKSEYVKYVNIISINENNKDYIILTDSLNIYKSIANENKYFLNENISNNQNFIYKYQSFETILNFIINRHFADSIGKKTIEIISVFSFLGGEGKSYFIKNIGSYLIKNKKVAILDFFSDSNYVNDLSDLILYLANSNDFNNSDFLNSTSFGYYLPSFSNIKDFWNLNDIFYKNLIKYLTSLNFDLLIIENHFPFTRLEYKFIENSKYRFLIIDEQKMSSSIFRDKYFNNLGLSNVNVVYNNSFGDKMFSLPICKDIFLNDIVNERSDYYFAVKKILNGVINE